MSKSFTYIFHLLQHLYEVDNYNDSYFTPNETEPQNEWLTLPKST